MSWVPKSVEGSRGHPEVLDDLTWDYTRNNGVSNPAKQEPSNNSSRDKNGNRWNNSTNNNNKMD
jgi:hypothetical protein